MIKTHTKLLQATGLMAFGVVAWGSGHGLMAKEPLQLAGVPAALLSEPRSIEAGRDTTEAGAVAKRAKRTTLAFGDRLKVTFLENSEGIAGTASASDRNGAFFPRLDLSGEYSVDEDGSVLFPRLGRFSLAGRAADEVQSEIATTFARVMGRGGDVHISIVDRQPVYVLGSVKTPGSYKYNSGMVVLQAMALSGGLDRGLGQTNNLLDGMRESEHMQQTAVKVKRLLARQARLLADRDGQASIATSMRLVALVGEVDARSYLASENATLQLERRGRLQQGLMIEKSLEIAKMELQTLKRRHEQFDNQLSFHKSRVGDLQKVQQRGHLTRNTLFNAQGDLAETSGRQLDIKVAIAQAERRVLEAEIAKGKHEFDQRLGVDKELAALEQDLSDTERTLASLEIVAKVMRTASGTSVTAQRSSAPVIEIIRRVATGTTIVRATETTVLEPGDVLRVNMSTNAPAGFLGSPSSSAQRIKY